MPKPVIGISMSRVRHHGYDQDQSPAAYAQAVMTAGGLPVLIPNNQDAEILNILDGLILAGGGDFDPNLFGEVDRGTDWSGVSPARDLTELELLTKADPSLPVLGICRGVQALAVAFGGRLVQDIPFRGVFHRQRESREITTHTVRVNPDSVLGSVVGEEAISVNSFHHQAVDQTPPGFCAVAWAEDGILEGMEKPDRPFLVGVQWHPEALTENQVHARRLFERLVGASRHYRRLSDG